MSGTAATESLHLKWQTGSREGPGIDTWILKPKAIPSDTLPQVGSHLLGLLQTGETTFDYQRPSIMIMMMMMMNINNGKESQRSTGLTWEVFWKKREKGQKRGQRLVLEDKSGKRWGRRREKKRWEVGMAHPLKGNIAYIHRRCSSLLQLRLYPIRTPRTGRNTCLNRNILPFCEECKKDKELERGSFWDRNEETMFLRLLSVDLGDINHLWGTWSSWSADHVLGYLTVLLHCSGSVEPADAASVWQNVDWGGSKLTPWSLQELKAPVPFPSLSHHYSITLTPSFFPIC